MRLEEATLDMTELALNNPKQQEADSRLLVQFSMEPWHNQEESAKQGRPIYDEIEFVMIMVPGDKDSIIHRPARAMERNRFALQYQRFKTKQSQTFGTGTPLRAVSFLKSNQVKELEYFNVYTVEQLAAMSDANAQQFMGMHRLRQMANDFLTASREAAPMTAMREEMAKKDEQLAAQAEAIKDLGQQIKEMREERKDT